MKRAVAQFEPAVLLERLGLPAGAKIIGADYDHRTQCVDLIVTHPSFPEVQDGEVGQYMSYYNASKWSSE